MRHEPSGSIRTLAVLTGGAFTFSLAQTLVIPALPAVERRYGVGPSESVWLLSAFLLAASVSTPIAGRLGDVYGKRGMLLVALVLFGLGSLVCAVGASLAALIAGRAISGLGSVMVPLSIGIARDALPAGWVGIGIGLLTATLGVGGGLGLVASGVLIDHASIAWLFWPPLAVAVAVAWATWRHVPELGARTPARIDLAGATLLCLSLFSLLLAVSRGDHWGWRSPTVVCLLAAAAALALGWTRWELTVVQPMVDIRALLQRGVWPANAASFAVGYALYGALVLIPRLVQAPEASGYGLGASASASGLFVLPYSLATLVCGVLSGLVSRRWGVRTALVAGSLCAFTGYAQLAFVHDAPAVYLGSALLGCGTGLIVSSVATAVVHGVHRDQTGVAVGINTIMRTVGAAFGGQAAAAILSFGGASAAAPPESRFTIAFLMSAAAALAVLAAGTVIARDSGRAPAKA